MIASLELIVFLSYTCLIFFVKSYYLVEIIFAINLILMLGLRANIKKTFHFCFKLLPFILFTVIINVLVGDLNLGILIGIKLILVCMITYVFSSHMTPKMVSKGIEGLLFPLKLFRVNTRDIAIMVSISLAFIPIVGKEIQNLKYSLMSKGFKLNAKNIVKRPNVVLLPLIISIIKRTSEIEQSMISKGYQSL